MQEYRNRLQLMQDMINNAISVLNRDKSNTLDLIEEASQLFVAIGLADSSLNAYEFNKQNFEGDVVASFAGFDVYFTELTELCEQFITRCNNHGTVNP